VTETDEILGFAVTAAFRLPAVQQRRFHVLTQRLVMNPVVFLMMVPDVFLCGSQVRHPVPGSRLPVDKAGNAVTALVVASIERFLGKTYWAPTLATSCLGNSRITLYGFLTDCHHSFAITHFYSIFYNIVLIFYLKLSYIVIICLLIVLTSL
jgi:hypothetical protein